MRWKQARAWSLTARDSRGAGEFLSIPFLAYRHPMNAAARISSGFASPRTSAGADPKGRGRAVGPPRPPGIPRGRAITAGPRLGGDTRWRGTHVGNSANIEVAGLLFTGIAIMIRPSRGDLTCTQCTWEFPRLERGQQCPYSSWLVSPSRAATMPQSISQRGQTCWVRAAHRQAAGP